MLGPLGVFGRRVAPALVVFAALLLPVAARAQQKRLSLDDIYDPERRVNFGGAPVSGLAWIDGAHYAWPRSDGSGGVDWLRVDAASGAAQPLFDPAKMESAIAALPGLTSGDAHRLAHARGLTFSPMYAAALFTVSDDLYLYTFSTAAAVRLTYTPGEEALPSFSPNGTLVAFVRGHNLFVLDLATQRETPLTTDGAPKVLNGRLDWVYEEEIFGRGTNRAYWWSPDSSRLAFLRIDDTPVAGFTVVDHIPYDQTVETWDYPRAGEANPTARLGVARVTGSPVQWIDLQKYASGDYLIMSVSWTPDSQRVLHVVQNRTQTWLDLNVSPATGGEGQTLLRETSQTWVGLDDRCIDPSCGTADPVWLKDGSFLRLSSRTGWPHLYRYRADGTLIKPITDGKWEVRGLHGVDEAAGWIYFSATERSHTGLDVYRIKLEGNGLQRLSKAQGTHHADFSPDFSQYLDAWSDVVTPTQTRLVRSDGTDVRVVDDNIVAALGEYRLAKPEFLQVKTRDGFVMEAMMIKPVDFDASRRYPVYQFVYGGPHLPLVKNQWGGSQYLYHQLLADRGVIVWVCDNRTASGKGIESTWPVYRNFGELELRDIEDGLAWLRQQPYVDGSRIGLYGWSFGGFMTSYALTHSTSFVMGIAGGSVTDWRDYDSVYTERYMGLPQDNPDGYRKSAPRWAAANLHGALLLVHGAIDDNVHVDNTLQFAHELQKAHKSFQLMLYPKSRHAVVDPALVKHLREMMLAFTLEHLKPADTARATPSR